jgi:hypothetical protein
MIPSSFSVVLLRFKIANGFQLYLEKKSRTFVGHGLPLDKVNYVAVKIQFQT